MRVVPIPADIRNADWVVTTKVYSAPGGDLTDPVIPPAEGIIFQTHPEGSEEGTTWPAVGVVLELDDNDLAKIAAGARHILMAWPGTNMPVFMVPDIITIQEDD